MPLPLQAKRRGPELKSRAQTSEHTRLASRGRTRLLGCPCPEPWAARSAGLTRTELLAQGRLVNEAPALQQLAVIGESQDVDDRVGDGPARRGEAQEGPVVGGLGRDTTGDLVPLGDEVLQGEADIGQRGPQSGEPLLDSVAPQLHVRVRIVVHGIELDDFIKDVEVAGPDGFVELRVEPANGVLGGCGRRRAHAREPERDGPSRLEGIGHPLAEPPASRRSSDTPGKKKGP